MERQALRALGADAGQLLELLDETSREDRGADKAVRLEAGNLEAAKQAGHRLTELLVHLAAARR